MDTALLFPSANDAPLELGGFLPPNAPLEVDLGCGAGRFLLARAAANPGTFYIGVDRMMMRVRKLDARIVRLGLRNVRILRAEALHAMENHLPRNRVQTLYVHFPDPWPKRCHHRRRLFAQPHFLEHLSNLLLPGGTLQIATDHADYFAHIQRVLAPDPRFVAVPPVPRQPCEHTDFELIFRSQNLPVFEAAFSKGVAQSNVG